MADIAKVKPDVVYLLVGSRPNDYLRIDGHLVRACDPAFDANYRAKEVSFLRDLRATGAQVVVGTVLYSGRSSLPVEGSEQRIDCVNRVIESLPSAVPGVHVIDNNQLLCPSPGHCVEELGGDPVRSDGLHFDRGPGGDRVADWIMSALHAAIAPSTRPGTDPDTELASGAKVPPRTIEWLNRVNEQATGQAMDAARTKYWATKLVSGAPRDAVTRSVVASAAWRRHRVVEAYRAWLLKDPAPARLEHWQTWLASHTTAELDLYLATTVAGRDAGGATDAARAAHLAAALGLPDAAAAHFAHQLSNGESWTSVVRAGYFSLPAADTRITALAPRSAYTPPSDALIAEFRQSGDERTPLVKALATTS